MSRFCSSLFLIACVGCASARDEADGKQDAAIGGSLDDASSLDANGSSAGSDSGTTGGDCAFSGALATWSFTGETGTQASTAASASATGVTASALARSAGLTAVSGLSSINSSNWPTAAQLDATKYYAFSITPPASCMIAITTIEIDAKSSGTGPASAVAATSIDAYTQTTSVSTTAPETITLNTTATASPIEVRVYGFSATGVNGTLRLQQAVTVNGTIQ
jgi:hypothetical protein